MIPLLAILCVPVIFGLPTTKVTTTPTTTHHPITNPHVVVETSTDLSNETDIEEHVGLRASIEREIAHLRSSYQNVREDIDSWMSTPYHRNVVAPIFVGVMAGFAAIVVHCIAKAALRSCARKFRRLRLSRISCDVSGDKKRMLSKRNDSDDDDDI